MSQPPKLMSSQATPVSPNRCVGSAKEPCPRTHWIAVQLVRNADKVLRKSWWWWPQEVVAVRGYASEPFSALLPDGPRNGKLDGIGSVRFDHIPEGQADFRFFDFYTNIKKYCTDQLTE